MDTHRAIAPKYDRTDVARRKTVLAYKFYGCFAKLLDRKRTCMR
jgi:hypothetical protein